MKTYLLSFCLLLLLPSALASAQSLQLSPDEAVQKALERVQGRLIDIEYEYRSSGLNYYEVEIEQGRERFEVVVDAQSGLVLNVKLED